MLFGAFYADYRSDHLVWIHGYLKLKWYSLCNFIFLAECIQSSVQRKKLSNNGSSLFLKIVCLISLRSEINQSILQNVLLFSSVIVNVDQLMD